MAATGLASAGATVLIASRKAEMCEATAAEINEMGLAGQGHTLSAAMYHLTRASARWWAEVKNHTDDLHILMNNAGTTWGRTVPAIST